MEFKLFSIFYRFYNLSAMVRKSSSWIEQSLQSVRDPVIGIYWVYLNTEK